MLTGFPKQEAKEERQPCDLLLWSGQEQFQQDSEAAPGTPTRLLPLFLWSINLQLPWEASPDVTKCAVGTTTHHWETAVGICQGKNAFIQPLCPRGMETRHGNRKPLWVLLFFRHELAFWIFFKAMES